jgi:hypothetical protein
MIRLFNIVLCLFFLLVASSCQYHYGPDGNLTTENPEARTRNKAYIKSTGSKNRSIQEIEADIAALKVNLDLVTENLDKSARDHEAELLILRAEIQQLKQDYDDQLTRMYYVMGGVTLLLIAVCFIGVHTYVEKKIREEKVADIIT